jgi:hypothetical protein
MTAIALDLAMLAPVLIPGLAPTSVIASTWGSTVFRTPIDAPAAYGAIWHCGADDTQLCVGVIHWVVIGRLIVHGRVLSELVVNAFFFDASDF